MQKIQQVGRAASTADPALLNQISQLRTSQEQIKTAIVSQELGKLEDHVTNALNAAGQQYAGPVSDYQDWLDKQVLDRIDDEYGSDDAALLQAAYDGALSPRVAEIYQEEVRRFNGVLSRRNIQPPRNKPTVSAPLKGGTSGGAAHGTDSRSRSRTCTPRCDGGSHPKKHVRRTRNEHVLSPGAAGTRAPVPANLGRHGRHGYDVHERVEVLGIKGYRSDSPNSSGMTGEERRFRIWLAGFSDGEGSIGIYRINHKTASFDFRFTIYQHYEPIIRKIESKFGGYAHQCGDMRTPVWGVVYSSRKAIKMVRYLQPYLEVKRAQADRFLEVARIWPKQGRTRPRRLPVPESVIAERQMLANSVNAFNKKVRPNQAPEPVDEGCDGEGVTVDCASPERERDDLTNTATC